MSVILNAELDEYRYVPKVKILFMKYIDCRNDVETWKSVFAVLLYKLNINREFCIQSELSEEKWKEANSCRSGCNLVVLF
jgi:hypothetical protein